MKGTLKTVESHGSFRYMTFTCPKHGDFTLTRIAMKNGTLVGPSEECPECKAEYNAAHKDEIEAEKRRAKEAAEKKDRENKIAMALKFSNIPQEYQNVDLSTLSFADKGNAETLRQARLYVEHFEETRKKGVGLFLYGETGTGKTYLACAILRALMPAVRGRYAMTWQIIRAIKSSGFQYDPLTPFIEAPLLVIDEVGVQYGSKFEETALYPLIDTRVVERRPTIFISNVQPDTKDVSRREETVRGMLGERLWDRVQYRSVFLPLHGASVRKRYRSVDELVTEN